MDAYGVAVILIDHIGYCFSAHAARFHLSVTDEIQFLELCQDLLDRHKRQAGNAGESCLRSRAVPSDVTQHCSSVKILELYLIILVCHISSFSFFICLNFIVPLYFRANDISIRQRLQQSEQHQ